MPAYSIYRKIWVRKSIITMHTQLQCMIKYVKTSLVMRSPAANAKRRVLQIEIGKFDYECNIFL